MYSLFINLIIHTVYLNTLAGTGSTEVYLCYRQNMSRLCLLLCEADSEEVCDDDD